MINIKEIFTVGMILFAVIDIIGSVPIVIELRKKVGHIQIRKSIDCFSYNNDRFSFYWRRNSKYHWN